SSSNWTAAVSLNWTNGGRLYLLWLDDNGASSTDGEQQIDNFSLTLTGGSVVQNDLACTLITPTNNAAFVSGNSITAASTILNGTAPFTVEYFTNNDGGNTAFGSAGFSTTAPYNLDLGVLPVGAYSIVSLVTDSAGTPASTNSSTNTFYVADPI